MLNARDLAYPAQRGFSSRVAAVMKNALANAQMQLCVIKVPYYAVFHLFHTAVRGHATLYSTCADPKISLIWKMGIVFLHRLKLHFWGPRRNISSPKNVT